MRRTRLIEARRALGKTQAQVANEIKVDRTTVGEWERAKRPPDRASAPPTLALSESP